jgi:hypothetical protein
LLASPRGIYIRSQALHYALKAMKAVRSHRAEVSNIEDMEMLRECLFNIDVIELPTMNDGLEYKKI